MRIDYYSRRFLVPPVRAVQDEALATVDGTEFPFSVRVYRCVLIIHWNHMEELTNELNGFSGRHYANDAAEPALSKHLLVPRQQMSR